MLHEKSYYKPCRIRLHTICRTKVCDVSLAIEKAASISDDTSVENFEKQQKDESSSIVTALNNDALIVVRSLISEPVEIIKKLHARFNSHTTASEISKMSELFPLHYRKVHADMPKHIEKMAELLERLRRMSASESSIR